MSWKTGSVSIFMQQSRRLQRRFFKSRLGFDYATLRARLARKRVRKVLLVSDGQAYTSEQQFAPIIRFAVPIAQRFGFAFRIMSLEAAQALNARQLVGFAAIGIKLDFKTPPRDALAITRHFFDLAKSAGAHALVFDGDDDQAVLWPKVLSLSDGYIKKHRFTDIQMYQQGFIGKSNLTDYAARAFGTSFADDIIPETRGIDPSDIAKIMVGWSIALDDKIHDLSRDMAPLAVERSIDVLCRASVPETFWTFPVRDTAVQAITKMQDTYNIYAPQDRVDQQEYYREMQRSRISVSPFGFGELCWRDFETILCGALLVKPDMAHVKTQPDLFIPGETYAPVAWDYSDLEEVCARYLNNEPLRRKIVQQAQDQLRAALSQDWFLKRFQDVMQQLDLLK